MRADYFYELVDRLKSRLHADEVFTSWLSGEDSNFCRFNNSRVRQAGSVNQWRFRLRLIIGNRNAEADVTLTGESSEDSGRVAGILQTLRDQVAQLPEDPHLLYATEVRSSEDIRQGQLPDQRDVIGEIAAATKAVDMVGIYAGGRVARGFANSLGQKNWYETRNFNLDWSFYLRADKAVKSGYAGFKWRSNEFQKKVELARSQLGVLGREPRTIKPGRYRVYLSPAALLEVAEMLAWSGFSLKAQRTKNSPLIKMIDGDAQLSKAVTMQENTADGVAPGFEASGFLKPQNVVLIDQGVYNEALTSPRSAREYGVKTNGANDSEGPESFDLNAGNLSEDDITGELKTGVFINNLWYLNYSDRNSCRMTGMTRFASFWVENGKVIAPVSVMRFDESIYRMLGENLVGLTKERQWLQSSSTYGERSTDSAHLPGALVEDFCFTL